MTKINLEDCSAGFRKVFETIESCKSKSFGIKSVDHYQITSNELLALKQFSFLTVSKVNTKIFQLSKKDKIKWNAFKDQYYANTLQDS